MQDSAARYVVVTLSVCGGDDSFSCFLVSRLRRIWKKHNRQTNEDHTPRRVLRLGAGRLPSCGVQERPGFGAAGRYIHEENWAGMRGILK